MTVLASGTTKVPFLLDYIQYAPVASTVLDNATVLVDAFDTEIQYLNDSGEWITSGNQVKTSVQNASMIFDFIGALPPSFEYFV